MLNSNLSSWKNRYLTLQIARKHYAENESLMSPYEQKVIGDDLRSKTALWYQDIYSGVTGEYRQAIRNYQDAETRQAVERQRELSSWEPGKLNSELSLSETLIKRVLSGSTGGFGDPSPVDQLDQMYRDALDSGDRYKIRGTLEIIRTLTPSGSLPIGDRLRINELAKQAERDLSSLRVTDGMRQAASALDKAWASFLERRAELRDVGSVLDGHDPEDVLSASPFARALRLVEVKAGQVIIHGDQDPEVTGVSFDGLRISQAE